jgi:hypothetical protein
MEPGRKGEIAHAFLKHLLKEQGFDIDKNFRRKVGNVAKNSGLPFEEVLEYGTMLVTEIVTEVSEKGKTPTPEELDGHWGHGHH